MSGLFSSPKIPAPVVVQQAPTTTDPSVQAAAAAQAQAQAAAAGRASTILTSGQGVASAAPTTRKTLLGQ